MTELSSVEKFFLNTLSPGWLPPQLPTSLQNLTAQIKDMEREIDHLRKADKTAYKNYTCARVKLASRKCRNMQEEEAQRWYCRLQECADQMRKLAVSDIMLLKLNKVNLVTRRWLYDDRGQLMETDLA